MMSNEQRIAMERGALKQGAPGFPCRRRSCHAYFPTRAARDLHEDQVPHSVQERLHLSAVKRERDEAVRLVGYALHLRMHGERAPGGEETWSEFDRSAEEFLRALTAGYSPVRVPENTGKHPGESGETGMEPGSAAPGPTCTDMGSDGPVAK